MKNEAYVRLPYGDHFTHLVQSVGVPEELHSLCQLNGKAGFVVAPFEPTEYEPIVLLHPDRAEEYALDETDNGKWQPQTINLLMPKADERAAYAADFKRFHAQLEAGTFSKIVLARSERVSCKMLQQSKTLFMEACRRYPRMFIVLVSTTKSGTWLMATPEILLEGDGHSWHTIALAGTMKLSGDALSFDNPPAHTHHSSEEHHPTWSDKNIHEQRYVATYLSKKLSDFSANVVEKGPYTMRAANLVHLRSDFTFTLHNIDTIGHMLESLHPTPAVCGLPKDKARQFILENEHAPRHYYSGFVGLLNPSGATHLYVSLRCMQLSDDYCTLFAGGGLLSDSTEQQEWDETEAKMETMSLLLNLD